MFRPFCCGNPSFKTIFLCFVVAYLSWCIDRHVVFVSGVVLLDVCGRNACVPDGGQSVSQFKKDESLHAHRLGSVMYQNV